MEENNLSPEFNKVDLPKEDLFKYDDSLDSNYNSPPSSENVSVQPTNFLQSDKQSGMQDATQMFQTSQQSQLPQSQIDEDMGIFEMAGKSFVVGLGDMVDSFGDIADYMGGSSSSEISKEVYGTDTSKPISDSLHNFADYLQSYGDDVPGLTDLEDVTWDDLAEPEFWATGVARMLPFALSLMVPASGAAKLASMATKGAKFTRASRAIAKGAASIGSTKYNSALAASGLIKTGIATVSAGATANLIEGAALAGQTLNEGVRQGLTEAEAQNAANLVYRDNLASMGADIVQYGLFMGQMGIGKGVMAQAEKLGAKFAGTSTAKAVAGVAGKAATKSGVKALKAPGMRDVLQRSFKAIGMGAANGVTDGVVEQFQEVFQDWSVQRRIAEQKGEEFPDYLDFFLADEQRPTRVLSFATSLLMSGASNTIKTATENRVKLQKAIDERNESHEMLEIFNEDLEKGTYNVKRKVKVKQKDGTVKEEIVIDTLDAEQATIAGRDKAARTMIMNAVKQGDEQVIMEFFETKLQAGTISEEQHQIYKNTLDEVSTALGDKPTQNLDNMAKTELVANSWLNQTAKKELENQRELIEAKKAAIMEDSAMKPKRKKAEIAALDKLAKVSLKTQEDLVSATEERIEEIYSENEVRVKNEEFKKTTGKQIKEIVAKELRGEELTQEEQDTIAKDDTSKDFYKTTKNTQEFQRANESAKKKAGRKFKGFSLNRAKTKDGVYVYNKYNEKENTTSTITVGKDGVADMKTSDGDTTMSEIEKKAKEKREAKLKKQEEEKAKKEKEAKEKETKEFTSDELANDGDVVKTEYYTITDEDGNSQPVEVKTKKDGSREIVLKDEEGTTYNTIKYGKNNTSTNEQLIDAVHSSAAEEGYTLNKREGETREGFEANYSEKQIENRKKKRRAEREEANKSTEDKVEDKVDDSESKDDKSPNYLSLGNLKASTKLALNVAKTIVKAFINKENAVKILDKVDAALHKRRIRRAYFLGAGSNRALASMYARKSADGLISAHFFEEIFERGDEYAGVAQGLGIFINADAPADSEEEAIFHENFHIFRTLYGHLKEVGDMMKAIVGQPIYKKTKLEYQENILYALGGKRKKTQITQEDALEFLKKKQTESGQTSLFEIFTSVEEYAQSQGRAINDELRQEFYNLSLEALKAAGFKEIKDSAQVHIQDEALTKLGGLYGSVNQDLFVEGQGKQEYNTLLKSWKNKIKDSVTEEDAKTAFEAVSEGLYDNTKEDGQTLEERLSKIREIISEKKPRYGNFISTQKGLEKKRLKKKQALEEAKYILNQEGNFAHERAKKFVEEELNFLIAESKKDDFNVEQLSDYIEEKLKLDESVNEAYVELASEMLSEYEPGSKKYRETKASIAIQSDSIKSVIRTQHLTGLTQQMATKLGNVLAQSEMTEFIEKAEKQFVNEDIVAYDEEGNLKEVNADEVFALLLDENPRQISERLYAAIKFHVQLESQKTKDVISKDRLLGYVRDIIQGLKTQDAFIEKAYSLVKLKDSPNLDEQDKALASFFNTLITQYELVGRKDNEGKKLSLLESSEAFGSVLRGLYNEINSMTTEKALVMTNDGLSNEIDIQSASKVMDLVYGVASRSSDYLNKDNERLNLGFLNGIQFRDNQHIKYINGKKYNLQGRNLELAKNFHKRIEYMQDLAVFNYIGYEDKDLVNLINKYFLPPGVNESGVRFKITEEDLNNYRILDEVSNKEVTLKDYFSKDKIRELYFNSVSVDVSDKQELGNRVTSKGLQERAYNDLFKAVFNNVVVTKNKNYQISKIDKDLAEKEFAENIQNAIDNQEQFPSELETQVRFVDEFTPNGKTQITDIKTVHQFQRKGNETRIYNVVKDGDTYKAVLSKTYIKRDKGSFNLYAYENNENKIVNSMQVQADRTQNNILKAITAAFVAENSDSYMASVVTSEGKNLNLTARKYALIYNAESLRDFAAMNPGSFEDLFTYENNTNPYAMAMLGRKYDLLYKTLVGHRDTAQDRQNISSEEITKGDLKEINRALDANSTMYAQVVRDYSDKSRRYYAAAKLIKADQELDFDLLESEMQQQDLFSGLTEKQKIAEESKFKKDYIKSNTKNLQAELKKLRKYHNAKTKFIVDNHNSDSDFSLFDVANQDTIDFIHKKYPLKDYSKTASKSKGELNLLGDLAFQQTIDGKVYDILKIETHFKMMEELNMKPEDVVASMNYTINKYYLQDLNSNIEEEQSFGMKIKRSTGFIAPHNSVYANNRVETLLFEDQDLLSVNDANKVQILDSSGLREVELTPALADSASYITEEEAIRLENAHGGLADVKGSFKLVGFGRNIDNKSIAGLTGQKSNQFYMKGHTIVLNSKVTGPLKGVYDNLKKREQFYADNKLSDHRVIAYADSGAKKFNIKNVNKYTLQELNSEDFNVNEKLDSWSFDESNNLRGFDGKFFGIQNELDKDSVTATVAKQGMSNINVFADSVHPSLVEGSRAVMQAYTDALEMQYEQELAKLTFDELAQQDIDSDSMKPIDRVMLSEGKTSLPSIRETLTNLANSKMTKLSTKLRTKGTLSLQESDIIQGFTLNDDGELVSTDDSLKPVRVTNDGVMHAEAAISQHMAKMLGVTNKDLKAGKEVLFLATRIPASSAGSTVVLKVSKISSRPGNTIAINSNMSHIIGSDLDGDMLHINMLETGDELTEMQVAKNKVVQATIDLYSQPEIVSMLAKVIEFESVTKKTNKALYGNENGPTDIDNDLNLLGTKNVYETSKGNVPMIGIIASSNLVYNYISEGSPEMFFKKMPIQFTTSDGRMLQNIDNEIDVDGNGTFYEVTKYLNLVLDDGKNNNRENFQFIKETASMFTMMMKFGVKPEEISKFLLKVNWKAFKGLTQAQLNTEFDNAFDFLQDEKEKREDVVNRIFNKNGYLDFDLNKVPSSTGDEVDAMATIMYYVLKNIGDDVLSLSQFVGMDKKITVNPISALVQHQDAIEALNNQEGVKENVAKNNPFFKRNVELSERIIDKSIKETSTLNNGYFDGLVGTYDFETIKDSEGILGLEIEETDTSFVSRSIFTDNSNGLVSDTELIEKTVAAMNLARVLNHANYDIKDRLRKLILNMESLGFKDQDLETFSDMELIEFSSVGAAQIIAELQEDIKFDNNKWVGVDGVLKINKKEIFYYGDNGQIKQNDLVDISLNSIKLQQQLEFTEHVEMFRKDFAALPFNLRQFLSINDLLKTGWGTKDSSKSIIPYAQTEVTKQVNDYFANVNDEKKSNFTSDMQDIKDKLKHVLNFTGNNAVDNRRIALLMYLGVHGVNASSKINKEKQKVFTNEFARGLFNVKTQGITSNDLNHITNVQGDNHLLFKEEKISNEVKEKRSVFQKGQSITYNNQLPELGMLQTLGALTTKDIKDDGVTYHDVGKKKYLKVSSNSRAFYGETGVELSAKEYSKLILPRGVDFESLAPAEREDFNLQYKVYQESVKKAAAIKKELGTKLDDTTYRLIKDNKEDSKKALDERFERVRGVYAQLRDDISKGTVVVNGENFSMDAIAFDTLLRVAQTKFGNHIAEKQIADWEYAHGESFVETIIDGKYKRAKDISHLKLWMSPGDFGKTKPAIAYINKNIKKTHMKYTRNLALVAKEMNDKLDKLFKSKMAEFGGEAKMKLKKFYMNYMPIGTLSYNEILFGNFYETQTGIRKVVDGNNITYKDVSNLQLKESLFKMTKRDGIYELKRNGDAYKALSPEEKDYIEMYVKYTNFYKQLIRAKGLYENTKGANYVANINANSWETYHRRGLFGMYYQMFKGDAVLNDIVIEAYNPITGETEKLDFFSWKAIFMHAPGESFTVKETKTVRGRRQSVESAAESLQTMTGPQRIQAFREIQKRAEKLWELGKDDDNNDINVESPVNDIMKLESEEAVNRHVHKRSMTSSYLATHNIHQALNTYVRDFMFLHGNMFFDSEAQVWNTLSWAGDDKAVEHSYISADNLQTERNKVNYSDLTRLEPINGDASLKQYDLSFSGFNDKTAEIDAAINNLGEFNENSVKFLEKVVKGGFLLKEKNLTLSDSPYKILSKQPERVLVNFFTQWTMYVALGFNIPAAIGNVAIGKYNAYRLAGGKALRKGEARFWGIKSNGTYDNASRVKARKMIDEFGILTYRAEEISEGIGTSSLSSLIFAPMVLAENNIQQASFLGMLSQEQWEAYYIAEDGTLKFNEDLAAKTGARKLSQEDIAKLERKVIDVQGRGYSATDMRYIQLYSLGNMVMQFKRWFPTFLADRFKKEDVNDLGDMTIGSITAARKFIDKMNKEGKLSKPKEFKKELAKFEPHVRDGVMRVLYGTNGIMVASLLFAISKAGQDDDEPQDETSKFFEKLLGDMLLLGNVPKLTYMTNIPASDTVENLALALYHTAMQTEYQRKAKYGDKGDAKAVAHFARLIPTALRGPLQLSNKKDRNKRVLK